MINIFYNYAFPLPIFDTMFYFFSVKHRSVELSYISEF